MKKLLIAIFVIALPEIFNTMTADAQSISNPSARGERIITGTWADDLIIICRPTGYPTLFLGTLENPKTAEELRLLKKQKGQDGTSISTASSGELVRYSAGMRTGSEVIQKKCGDLEIAISAYYPNANPNGEGGVYVYPQATVMLGNKPVAPSTIISDQCIQDVYRFDNCVTRWAAIVTVMLRPMPDGASVTYHRQYEESKAVPTNHAK